MYKKCRKDKSLRNMISYSVDEAPIFKKYHKESETLLSAFRVMYAHEAGFDSFMAGCVFLSTAKYREIGVALEAQKAAKERNKKNGNVKRGRRNRREMKAEDKDTGTNSQNSTGNSKQLWSDIRGEKIDFSSMDIYKNKIVLDLNERYFDFSEEFDGSEPNFNPDNVVWIRWCKRKDTTHQKEDYKNSEVVYDDENKIEILSSKLAEILSSYGDVSVVKDSPVSAYVEFTSFEPKEFKRSVKKEKLFKTQSVLNLIRDKLEDETFIKPFEVLPYEKAEKF